MADQADDLGAVLWTCKPRPVRSFLASIDAVPNDAFAPSVLNFWHRWFGPYLRTFLLAGIPLVALIIPWSNVLHLGKPETATVVGLTLFMIGWAAAWLWVFPRHDYLVIHECGFRWRISLSRWELFPGKGAVLFKALRSFRYREHWGYPESLRAASAGTAEQRFEKLVSLLDLDANDLEITDATGSVRIIERIFIRFERQDLERFLAHVDQHWPALVAIVD